MRGIKAPFLYRGILMVWMLVCMFSARAQTCLVAIDAGHTRENVGAISARGVGEWHFNIALAKKLAASLKEQMIPHVLINPDGDDMALRDRTDAAAQAGATLFVSLHHDAVQPHYLSEWEWAGEKRLYSDHFSGYSLFVAAGNPAYEESRKVAGRIADSLLGEGMTPALHHAEAIAGENRQLLDSGRGIYLFDELVVLRESSSAAVLVEAGIIVNREEELKVSTLAYQEKITGALAVAIRAHCTRLGN
ncbi:N-acetylmuramoyl-L-alanine amidase [Oxalobacter sp. OttesenSCG-928-P03]|nr:N-acetylmuramoyl-L-alanine amidase [Oxalobacter sp. OttesenSCG-928-P03]